MKISFNPGFIHLAAAIINQANDDLKSGAKGYFKNRKWCCRDGLTYEDYKTALEFKDSPEKEFYTNIIVDCCNLNSSDYMNMKCSVRGLD